MAQNQKVEGGNGESAEAQEIAAPSKSFSLSHHHCYDFFLYDTLAALVFPKLFFPTFERLCEKIISIRSERNFIGYFLYFARCSYNVASNHFSHSLLKLA